MQVYGFLPPAGGLSSDEQMIGLFVNKEYTRALNVRDTSRAIQTTMSPDAAADLMGDLGAPDEEVAEWLALQKMKESKAG